MNYYVFTIKVGGYGRDLAEAWENATDTTELNKWSVEDCDSVELIESDLQDEDQEEI